MSCSQRNWRTAVAAAILVPSLALAACGSNDSGGDGGSAASSSGGQASSEPIKIGLAIASSGPIAPYDVEAGQAAKLRAKEINAAGGVNGRKLEMVVKDTQSDKGLAANVASELAADGAVAIIASCDFDYGSPAAISAQAAKVPGISMCASDPKFADKKTIGDYAFTMGVGSDVEGASNAEFAYNNQNWRSVYVLQDESIEYTKALGRYFVARWKELGGQTVGTDSFPGGDNVNIKSQAQKIRGLAQQPDFIYLPSWNPGAATAIRQIRAAGVKTPVLGPAALDSAALGDIAGGASDVYLSPYACYVYCTGQEEKAPGLAEFADAFEAEYGKSPSSAYDIAAYNLVTAIADAAKKAGEDVNGTTVRDGLQNLGTIETPAGSQKLFTPDCHKPSRAELAYVKMSGGKQSYVGSFSVESIPDLGDGNPCVGS
jgi:branched-chain amino acid transport system substrate-binding protein